jgi:bifunctional DNA-binding transcriptional regulator/antitoxin component of YhaV-PrlF toxin-antitoxin module
VSVVKIDERGRLTLPRELRDRDKAVMINVGAFVVVIPLPKQPEVRALSWLNSKKNTRGLKEVAEEKAKEDAVSRSRRHRQT